MTCTHACCTGCKRGKLLVLMHGEKTGDLDVREAINRLRSEGHQVRMQSRIRYHSTVTMYVLCVLTHHRIANCLTQIDMCQSE